MRKTGRLAASVAGICAFCGSALAQELPPPPPAPPASTAPAPSGPNPPASPGYAAVPSTADSASDEEATSAPARHINTGGSTSTSIESEPLPATADESRRFPILGSWTDGLQFESEDKQYHFHVGGIGQIDSVWYIGPASEFNNAGGSSSTVQNASATLLRRAILQADGDLFQQFDFVIQFDFANASNDNDTEQAPTFGNLTTSPAVHAAPHPYR